MENLTDEELDQHRRDVLIEQERRQKLEQGLYRIGEQIAAYLDADGVEVTAEHEELGRDAVEAITGTRPARFGDT